MTRELQADARCTGHQKVGFEVDFANKRLKVSARSAGKEGIWF